MANTAAPKIIAPETVKDRGHVATLRLEVEAESRDLRTLWPSGDNLPFDVVLMPSLEKFIRVQVKSSLKGDGKGRYGFVIGHGADHHKQYTKKIVDVLALYAFDINTWWFLPVEETVGYANIHIGDSGKWATYKNNWEIFNG